MSGPHFFANTLAITNGENLHVSWVFWELSYVYVHVCFEWLPLNILIEIFHWWVLKLVSFYCLLIDLFWRDFGKWCRGIKYEKGLLVWTLDNECSFKVSCYSIFEFHVSITTEFQILLFYNYGCFLSVLSACNRNNSVDGKASPQRKLLKGKFPCVSNDRWGDRIEGFVPLL